MPKASTSLRRRMAIHLSLMAAGSLLLGIAAVLGVERLHQDFSIASCGYRQLRQVYDIGFAVATAKRALLATPGNRTETIQAIELAKSIANDRSTIWLKESDRAALCSRIDTLLLSLNPAEDSHLFATPPDAALNKLFAQLSSISQQVQQSIERTESAATAQRSQTLYAIALLSLCILMIAIAVGWRLYRAVVLPLDRVRSGVDSFAKGSWSERVSTNEDREFAGLASAFNQMAVELEALYRDLENQVADRSRQLVRAEQLATVGYLAAGVAHEINNPLGIIAGYAERCLQLNDPAKTDRALQIICEEAFRCRQITDRLLSLARPSSEEKQRSSLSQLAEEVVSVLNGVANNKGKTIHFESDAPISDVNARVGEMKQAILNLVLNSLEAVEEKNGEIVVRVAREKDTIRLMVRDNGKGIEPEQLERVFEPFYTDKRDEGRTGTGLGLSIVQAIVIEHGGQVQAISDGRGKGSTFVVTLPAVKGTEE